MKYNPYGSRMYQSGSGALSTSEEQKLKSYIDSLRGYFSKIEKVYCNRLSETSTENMKKLKNLKEFTKEISMMVMS